MRPEEVKSKKKKPEIVKISLISRDVIIKIVV
jgi:hypothetical protein